MYKYVLVKNWHLCKSKKTKISTYINVINKFNLFSEILSGKLIRMDKKNMILVQKRTQGAIVHVRAEVTLYDRCSVHAY